ncbi:MAG: hypothetical protein UX08_C0021G0002 [Candidatus Collierbacteria bacterium GW2011_GWB1_45_35]|uniref:Uncharacterized protein n=1 Tax=Candidatus Collierbacteria bacterium GW2011_GWB2_45_17 TaxID=1618388 RepID=A0A837IPA3_9BACT|nr:MAG: hypothetical protein UX01_C0010G0058 [Candidatus Collierbacteria bacterium GW2011_GWB2_45_17]KKU04588.1 MAG: hypothetical protein UX08_C0021G0002 [Candidatus Collierbacteria bacterium GW2011_GWB1_45_35]
MLITDYSESSLRGCLGDRGNLYNKNSFLPELLTAGLIFILPIIFLLVITAS